MTKKERDAAKDMAVASALNLVTLCGLNFQLFECLLSTDHIICISKLREILTYVKKKGAESETAWRQVCIDCYGHPCCDVQSRNLILKMRHRDMQRIMANSKCHRNHFQVSRSPYCTLVLLSHNSHSRLGVPFEQQCWFSFRAALFPLWTVTSTIINIMGVVVRSIRHQPEQNIGPTFYICATIGMYAAARHDPTCPQEDYSERDQLEIRALPKCIPLCEIDNFCWPSLLRPKLVVRRMSTNPRRMDSECWHWFFSVILTLL